jgi:uncharacterized membrane protein YccC
MTAMAAWVEAGADAETAQSLFRRLEAWKSENLGADWRALLRHSLFCRFQDLLSDLGDGHRLHDALQTPPRALPETLASQLAKRTRKPLHRDLGLAALSGLSAFLSIFLMCVLWIQTGWTDGAAAAALAGVFCALFAALDDPAPAIKGFGMMFGLSIPVAASYQFAVLPGIDGLPLLLLFLSPVFLVGGALMVNRATAGPALAFLLGFSSALAFQETYSADFAAFINSNTAIYVSLFIAILVTRAVRTISVDTAAQRLLRRTWRQLAVLARSQGVADPIELAAEMIDRIGLLAPKLAATSETSVSGMDVLTDLRIGMNLAQIQHYRALTNQDCANRISELLQRVGAYFASLSTGTTEAPPPATLAALDRCLTATVQHDDSSEARRAGIAALVGLRRNLFPAAPAFASEVLS